LGGLSRRFSLLDRLGRRLRSGWRRSRFRRRGWSSRRRGSLLSSGLGLRRLGRVFFGRRTATGDRDQYQPQKGIF